MSEEKEETKITLEITLPTKEKIVETLRAIFPGITIKITGEKEEETEPQQETAESTEAES